MILAGDGENYFKFDATGSMDDADIWDDGAGGHVKQVVICHDGDLIRSIQTIYERQSNMLLSGRHGATGGSVDVISFSEPLKWVSGHCRQDLNFNTNRLQHVIRSLKFGTDHETYGPFGCRSFDEDDSPFHFKTSTWIGGFHGCSSGGAHGCLSAIGVYIWSPAARLMDHEPPSPAVVKPASPRKSRS